jgi:hypothetical protein
MGPGAAKPPDNAPPEAGRRVPASDGRYRGPRRAFFARWGGMGVRRGEARRSTKGLGSRVSRVLPEYRFEVCRLRRDQAAPQISDFSESRRSRDDREVTRIDGLVDFLPSERR